MAGLPLINFPALANQALDQLISYGTSAARDLAVETYQAYRDGKISYPVAIKEMQQGGRYKTSKFRRTGNYYKRGTPFSGGGQYRKVGYYGRFGSKLAAGEMKFHDIAVDQNPVAAAGSILNTGTINIIPQNSTENGRIGRKSVIRNIGWRYSVVLPSVAGVNAMVNDSDTCRVVLYLDKQCNGVTAAVSGDSGILQQALYQSFNNLVSKGRFTILMDRTYSMNHTTGGSDGATGDVSEVRIDATFFKKCNIEIEFDNSFVDGRLTTIKSNNIGVLCISARGLVRIESEVRLRFTDS